MASILFDGTACRLRSYVRPRDPGRTPPPRGRHRRASTSLELRIRLVRAIAATVYARKLTAEGLRLLLGEAEGGVGSIRRELAHIRAHRAEPFGVERLQVLVEVLGLDLFGILVGQAPDTRLAS